MAHGRGRRKRQQQHRLLDRIKKKTTCKACDEGIKLKLRNRESTACLACRMLVDTKRELYKHVRISTFVHARPNGELDTAKVDILILLSNGLAVGLQLKSHRNSANRHRRVAPHIPCMVIPQKLDDPHIVATCIGRFINRILRFTSKDLDPPKGD